VDPPVNPSEEGEFFDASGRWATKHRACALTGASISSLKRWRGEDVRTREIDNVWFYHVGDVQRQKGGGQPTTDALAPAGSSMPDVMLRQSYDFIATLLIPHKVVVAQLTELSNRHFSRCAELENLTRQMYLIHDQNLTQEQEREQIRLSSEQDREIKAQVIDKLMELGPVIATMLANHFMPPSAGAGQAAFAEYLASISDENFDEIIRSGKFDAHGIAMLRELRDLFRSRKQKGNAA
jgi:hypothetical protein